MTGAAGAKDGGGVAGGERWGGREGDGGGGYGYGADLAVVGAEVVGEGVVCQSLIRSAGSGNGVADLLTR